MVYDFKLQISNIKFKGDGVVLRLQAADRDDIYAIGAAISVLTAGENHQHIRKTNRHLFFGSVMLLNQVLQFQQMFGAIVYLTASELTFNQRVPFIAQMQHDVCLQTITVVVIGQMSRVSILRESAQVTDTELFKDKAKCLELHLQSVRRKTQCRHSHRRVTETPLG